MTKPDTRSASRKTKSTAFIVDLINDVINDLNLVLSIKRQLATKPPPGIIYIGRAEPHVTPIQLQRVILETERKRN
jgi:hypothetical protein